LDFKVICLQLNKNDITLQCQSFKMNFFLYLSSCDTCKRIQKELNLPREITLIDIKKYPLNFKQLSLLHEAAGSYESLINKRAQLLKQPHLKDKELTEDDYRDLLLDHYTFLKRPVLVYKNKYFIGNSKNTVEQARNWINEQ
jgi:arsenate reductase